MGLFKSFIYLTLFRLTVGRRDVPEPWGLRFESLISKVRSYSKIPALRKWLLTPICFWHLSRTKSFAPIQERRREVCLAALYKTLQNLWTMFSFQKRPGDLGPEDWVVWQQNLKWSIPWFLQRNIAAGQSHVALTHQAKISPSWPLKATVSVLLLLSGWTNS